MKDLEDIQAQNPEQGFQFPGVFEITAEELANADKYEVADYKRVAAPLASGRTAWVYDHASIARHLIDAACR